MPTSPRQCAHQILDVTPILLQAIRHEMRCLRTTDLTVPQFRTLSYLSHNPGASLSAVAEFIGLTLSSMSILVNALVDRNLVERATDSKDRRRVHLTVTQPGRSMLEKTLQATEAYLAEMVAGLSDSERTIIVEGLEILRPLFAPGATSPQHAATLESTATP